MTQATFLETKFTNITFHLKKLFMIMKISDHTQTQLYCSENVTPTSQKDQK